MVGNAVAVVLGLACLFGIYPDSILEHGIDRTSFIIYQSLSRTVWSMTIGWLFFVCITNRGGIVNKILSWPIWAPLARLNYSTYLIHLTVIFITMNNQRFPFYYQPHMVVNLFFTQVFFSYVTGILVSVFIETPFFILEKKLFKRWIFNKTTGWRSFRDDPLVTSFWFDFSNKSSLSNESSLKNDWFLRI